MHRFLQFAASFAVIGLLLVPATAHAQGAGVGVKGGLLYSSFDFENVQEVIDSRSGWMAGLFFGGNRPGAVGVMGEINLLRKAGTYQGESISIDYIQVPVFLRINIGNNDIAGYVIAGPNFDIKYADAGNVVLFSEYEGFDVGVTAGAGVELSRFIIEARSTWGLRNIAKDFMASELKTRSFALLVGLRFN